MLKQESIEEITKKRFPEALALIVTKNTSGKVNLCPVGFFAMVSWEPRIWAIGLYKTHYTTRIISETKECVLCLPSIEQAKDILYCGSVHGWNIDKTKSINLKFKESEKVKPPLIKDSVACFECKVIKDIECGDHILFLGKVVAAYESDKTWKDKLYNWDDKKLGTLDFGDKSIEIPYSPEEG